MSTSNSTAILCLFIGLEEMLHRSGNRRWRLRKEGLEFEFRLALGSGDKQQHYYYYNTDSIRPPPLEDLSPMSLVFRGFGCTVGSWRLEQGIPRLWLRKVFKAFTAIVFYRLCFSLEFYRYHSTRLYICYWIVCFLPSDQTAGLEKGLRDTRQQQRGEEASL